jgi:hypothetical protein
MFVTVDLVQPMSWRLAEPDAFRSLAIEREQFRAAPRHFLAQLSDAQTRRRTLDAIEAKITPIDTAMSGCPKNTQVRRKTLALVSQKFPAIRAGFERSKKMTIDAANSG